MIDEAISDDSILLFIDEIHLLCGAGSSEGSMDAANIVFMMFIGAFASALYFPMISVISVCGVLFAGRVFLKERVSRRAWIGIGLSAVALMLLAIS